MTVPARYTSASQNYTYKYVSDPGREYEINFKFLGEDENISAFLRMTDGTRFDLKEGTHFSIRILGGNNNIWGSLKFVSGSELPSEGVDYLCIFRNIPNDQNKTYDSQTVFSNITEFCLDKLTMLLQDYIQSSKFLRAPPDAETDSSALELPAMNNWTEEKVIGFGNDKKIKLYDYSNPVSNRGIRQPNEETPDTSFVISTEERSDKVLGFGENGEVSMIPKNQLRSDFREEDTSKYGYILNKPRAATGSEEGYMSPNDKEKLDSIEYFAEKNFEITEGYNTLITEVNVANRWDSGSGAEGDFYGTDYGEGLFFVAGREGKIYKSEDAKIWYREDSGITEDITCIKYVDGIFVCGTEIPGTILKRTETGWISVSLGIGNFKVRSVAYANGIYVAVGDGGIATSADLITWNLRYSEVNLKGVCFGDDKFVAVGNGSVCVSEDGIVWIRTQVIFNLSSVTFGYGLFVAVGSAGTILTSKNGVDWKSENSGTSAYLYGIIYAEGLFVATGSEESRVTGHNGIKWKVKTGEDKVLTGICYGKNRYVAAGFGSVVLFSDAEKGKMIAEEILSKQSDWNQNDSSESDFIKNKPDVAVKGDITVLQNEINSNTDQIENLQQQIEAKSYFLGYYETSSEIESLSGTEGDYAYCAETGTKWIYSNDQWTDSGVPVPDQSVPPSDALPNADSGSGNAGTSDFYSRGDHIHPITPNATETVGGLMSATDKSKLNGIENNAQKNVKANWSQTNPLAPDYIENKPSSHELKPADRVSLGGVIIGENLNITENGTVSGLEIIGLGNISAFTEIRYGLKKRNTASSQDLYAVTYGNGLYVAAGNGSIAESLDGIHWDNKANIPSRIFYGIVRGANLFVAVGSGGSIITSPNGQSWTVRNSGVSETLRSIAYGNNSYVAVGDNKTVLKSADGITWEKINFYYDNVNLYGITFGNNYFIAVGNNGGMYNTPDVKNWGHINSGITTDLKSICYGNGHFLACGNGGIILYSSDMYNWSGYTIADNNLSCAAFGNGKYIVGSSTGSGFVCNNLKSDLWLKTNSEGNGSVYGTAINGDFPVQVGKEGYIAGGDSRLNKYVLIIKV